ncbi:MAG: bifunctional DNA primase/helicase [Dehalococcoidia bacterium]
MITPRDFADRHFRDYKIHGDEIIPRYCPYCSGGDKHDKHTFAMNATSGTYNCKRGSCGASGTFWKICKEHGEQVETRKNYELHSRPKVEYKKPQTVPVPVQTATEKYLRARGFTPETWQRRDVAEVGGNIAMPYYDEGGELVMMKFRPAHKPKGGEKKGWREAGGKPVFWGMHLCNIEQALVICEGEMDALALDEAGVQNVVSVPSGAEDLTCVDLCWDWLNKFKLVVLWADNDEPGRKLQRNLINKIGEWRCLVVVNERKDANEVLVYDGKEAVKRAVAYAVEVPVSGIIRLADVSVFDATEAVRVKSGIKGVDKVMGGFFMGQTSVWTGINSSGKSTLIGQLMLEAVEQGFGVCAHSGELPAPIFRYWIDLQAAGPAFLERKYDSIRERETTSAKKEIVQYIRDWYRDKFFLHDSIGDSTNKDLLEIFEYAARRYDCRVFLIDNLMTTVTSDSGSDFYRKQSEFVGRVIEFAKKFDVHVHIVAHPRKTTGRLTKMDVSGSGDITNRPDNVLSVHRLTPEEREKESYDAMVDIFKNRLFGWQDVAVRLKFDDNCKRFYWADEPGAVKQYSWIKLMPKQPSLLTQGVESTDEAFNF